MKKKNLILFLFATILLFLLTSCSLESSGHTPEDCPDVFVAGQQDAIEKIQDSAESAWDTYYVDIEALEDVMRIYFGDSADEIRDMLIYHPDVERYTSSDIVNNLIDDYYWEFE